MRFLQETKCSTVSRLLVEGLWGGSECDWVVKNDAGLSRGMLVVWNSALLEAIFFLKWERFWGVFR